MEEIDLCWRAKNKGLSVTYVGNSTVYHVGGASLDNSHPKKTYLNFRNSLYTLVKNTSKPLVIVILLRLILDGIAGLHFLLQAKPKHMIAIIKAHGSFYRALPYLFRYRRENSFAKPYKLHPSIVWSYFVKSEKYFTKL